MLVISEIDSYKELGRQAMSKVIGAKNSIVNLGGGMTYVLQTNDTTGEVGTAWLCTDKQCINLVDRPK